MTESMAESMAESTQAALLTSGRAWGVCLRDVPGLAADAGVLEAIERAASAGATLLQLPSVQAASATLDPGELRTVRACAADTGVTLTAALPPAHPDRLSWVWGTDPDAVGHPLAQLQAGEHLGIASWHVTVGQEADRLRLDPSWASQLHRTVPVLRSLVAVASCPVVLKTHEEMTTFELERLCGQVPGLAVGLSPVNVVARLEDPLAATARVAPLVHSVFLDDCALVRVPDGLTRAMRRLGEGCLPWADILDLVPPQAPIVVDLHRAELRMPLHSPAWLAHQPDLTPAELAALYARSEPGSSEPGRPRPGGPGSDRLEERLRRAEQLLASRAPASMAGAR